LLPDNGRRANAQHNCRKNDDGEGEQKDLTQADEGKIAFDSSSRNMIHDRIPQLARAFTLVPKR
jgi:hypothetical protein